MSRLIIIILITLPNLSFAEDLNGKNFCELAPELARSIVFNRVLGNSADTMILQSTSLSKSSSPELRAFGKYVLDTVDIVYNQYDFTFLTLNTQLESIESDAATKSLLLCLNSLSNLTFSSSDLTQINSIVEAAFKAPLNPPINPPYHLAEGTPEAWSVQVMAFSKIDHALKAKADLSQSGYEAYIRESDGLYRVLVGPSLTQERATETLESIQKTFGLAGRVVRYTP